MKRLIHRDDYRTCTILFDEKPTGELTPCFVSVAFDNTIAWADLQNWAFTLVTPLAATILADTLHNICNIETIVTDNRCHLLNPTTASLVHGIEDINNGSTCCVNTSHPILQYFNPPHQLEPKDFSAALAAYTAHDSTLLAAQSETNDFGY